MKKTLAIAMAAFCFIGTAQAADIAATHHGKTVLKTSRSSQCDTPSGKTQKQCQHNPGTHAPRHF